VGEFLPAVVEAVCGAVEPPWQGAVTEKDRAAAEAD
jgi:hypothetical protein